jgi:gliding motility-associated-like protein
VSLIVNAAPSITVTSNSPVCEGSTIEFNANCVPGATYEWTGPGGFSSSVCNPVVANANPALNAGTYTARMLVGGCWSDLVSVNVTINEEPAVPAAINAGPYCASTDNVMLSVTPQSATPGATYTWYNLNGQPLGAATPSLNFQLPNPAQYGEGTEEFYVIATLNGCASLPSVPTVVTLNLVPPNEAEAGADLTACEGDIIGLTATTPTVGTGLWALTAGNPAGVTIANPDEPNTTVAGLLPGQPYTFTWYLSNGACENYSTDAMSVFVDFLEDADAGEPITICFANTVTLDAAVPSSNVGVWTQPQAQAALGVAIVDPDDPNTGVTGLAAGNSYVFTWTIDGGCGTTSDAVLVTVTNESAFAGADFMACGDETDRCALLSATAALNGSGSWASATPGVSFAAPTQASTTACNLQPGENILIWTINDGACGHHSVDSVVVDYAVLTAEDDEATVPFAGEGFVNVLFNDDIFGTATVSVVEEPANGTLTVGQNGLLTYQADINFVGDDVAVYEACQEGCSCVTATITFHVGEDADCVVPSIITPNGDGMNDAFVIPCFAEGEAYPNSTVSIFNQWGDEVFHAEPYANNWQGTFDGEDLPASTYFYIVDLGNGDEPMTGYLIIQR